MSQSPNKISLLFEDEIRKAVQNYLRRHGYHVCDPRGITEHGVDLEALAPDGKTKIYVEAKGQTSSNPKTKNYGNEFTSSQKRNHLAMAFFKSCESIRRDDQDPAITCIAIPNAPKDVKLVDSIQWALSKLRIVVFLVEKNGNVQVRGELP